MNTYAKRGEGGCDHFWGYRPGTSLTKQTRRAFLWTPVGPAQRVAKMRQIVVSLLTTPIILVHTV